MRVVVTIVLGREDEGEKSEEREPMMATGRTRAIHAQLEDNENTSGRESSVIHLLHVFVSSYKESSDAAEEEGDEAIEIDGTAQQPVEDNRECIDKVCLPSWCRLYSNVLTDSMQENWKSWR